MKRRQIRKTLWGVALGMGVLSLGLLGWALLTPMGGGSAGDVAPGPETAGPSAESSPELPPLESFAVIWDRNLRGSLSGEVEEAAPVAAYEPPPMEQPLNVQLLGTALEEGRSVAVLMDERSLVQVKGVGEYVAGAKVARIENGRVVLEVNGRQTTLVLPEVYEGGGGMGAMDGGMGGGREYRSEYVP